MNYLVADAQNLGCAELLTSGADWLLFWEDDVLPPLDTFLQLNKYISKVDVPIVSGLYFTKGSHSEPQLYKDLGSGSFRNFKIGDKVWALSVPTGILLIHSSVIKLMWKESETYTTLGKRVTRKVFATDTELIFDAESGEFTTSRGTSDRLWCERVIREKVLARAGFPKIGRRKYPFLCDTGIFCKHIALPTGKIYPSADVLKEYIKESPGLR